MERRKILLIFVGAWISASLLVWLLYSSTKAPKIEKTVAIQAAARDMAAGTLLRTADLKTVRVPENDVPKFAVRDASQAIDHPLLFPVSANEPITLARIGSSTGVDGIAANIEPGKRAIAVPITDASSVAGLVQPRSHVDVLFTRPGQPAEAITTTVIEDVVVLAIGRNTEGTSAAAAAQTVGANSRASAQSATLLVTPEQARRIELAKNEGKISLALRNPLDHVRGEGRDSTTARELFPFTEKVPPKPAVVEKPVVAVEKKEPPKPKAVVELFRGDKHTQEVFR